MILLLVFLCWSGLWIFVPYVGRCICAKWTFHSCERWKSTNSTSPWDQQSGLEMEGDPQKGLFS